MQFVLIDKLVLLEPGRRAGARVTFPPDADFFADHFPGFPVVPGVLLTEAMGQAAGWLLAASMNFSRWPLLAMIDQAKFMRHVLPGEEVTIAVDVSGVHERDAEVTAEASVRGQRVARARLLFHTIDPPIDGPEAERFGQWAESTFRRLGGRDVLPGPSGQDGSRE